MVYKARHTRLDRLVAIKVLHYCRTDDSHMLSRFEREMRAVGQLNHPHIVLAHDAGDIDGVPYLVMEFAEGHDIGRLVAQLGPLPVADACEIARQTAQGLIYIHERGLVHRDLKPSNLILTSDGQVKILDLGLALLAEDRSRDSGLTDSHDTLGTVEYIAPEQITNCHYVDRRVDIYSLGCTLYRLLAGVPPFHGSQYPSRFDKLAAHVNESPPSVRDFRKEVPASLEAVLRRMLDKRPRNRFASAAEAVTALEPFTNGSDLRRLVRQSGRPPLISESPTDKGIRSALVDTDKSTLVVSPARLTRRKQTIRLFLPLAVLAILAGIIISISIKLRIGGKAEDPSHQGSRAAATAGPPAASAGVLSPAASTMASTPAWPRRRGDLAGTAFFPRPSRRLMGSELRPATWRPATEPNHVAFLRTGDVTGDGFVNVVLSDANVILVYDRWGKEIWKGHPIVDSGVVVPPGYAGRLAGLELANLDADRGLEVATVACSLRLEGWTRAAPQNAVVYDNDGSLLVNLPLLEGAASPCHNCFDVNGDGRHDFVFATAAYRHPHALCILDLNSGQSLFRADFADGCHLAGAADVDGDGTREMLIIQGFSGHVDPPVGDYDSDHCYATLYETNGTRRWKKTYPHWLEGCLLDLEGDGRLEVVLLNETESEAALHFVKPDSGDTLHVLTGLEVPSLRHWAVADVQGDGGKEILLGAGNTITVIDASGQIAAQRQLEAAHVLAANDLNGDGRTELIVAQDSNLVVLSGALDELARFPASGRVQTAIVTDLEGDGVNEVLMSVGARPHLKLEVIRFADREPNDFQPDVAEPSEVVRAFLAALRLGDLEGLLQHVAVPLRPSVRTRWPQLVRLEMPEDVDFHQAIHVDDGQIFVRSEPPLELSIRFEKQRWWVTKIDWER
jgi:serine/threonine protein kinase